MIQARKCWPVGKVAQAQEVEEGSRGHQQVVLVARDQPTQQEGVQGAVAARATEKLDAGTAMGWR